MMPCLQRHGDGSGCTNRVKYEKYSLVVAWISQIFHSEAKTVRAVSNLQSSSLSWLGLLRHPRMTLTDSTSPYLRQWARGCCQSKYDPATCFLGKPVGRLQVLSESRPKETSIWRPQAWPHGLFTVSIVNFGFSLL